MTALDRYLASVKERAAAATPGPWLNGYPNAGFLEPMSDHVWSAHKDLVAKDLIEGDARFIAHARTDVDRLREMVEDREAVLGTCRLAIEAALAQYVDFYGKQDNGPFYLKLRYALAELNLLAGEKKPTS